MYIPKEIHEYILQFIDDEDKIYASMTCTLWSNILKDMFHKKYNKYIVPTKCAYDLHLYLKHFKSSHIITVDHVWRRNPNIYIIISNTINCLNVLMNFGIQGAINNDIHSDLYGTANNIDVLFVIHEYISLKYCPKLEYISYIINNNSTEAKGLLENALCERIFYN